MGRCHELCETGQGGRFEADSHDTLCPERASSRAVSGVKPAKAEGSRPLTCNFWGETGQGGRLEAATVAVQFPV